MKTTATLFLLLLTASPLFSDDSGFTFISLRDCERIALESHPAVRLAEEEVTVARARKLEAAREIFPSITFKTEQTEGSADKASATPDFTEKNYGVQFSQPLFQGFKIRQTYIQSKANLQAARSKLEKARQETLFSARESYFNFAYAAAVVEIYRKNLSELAKEEEMADRLFKAGVITRQTALIIHAQYGQAVYQYESANADCESKLWQWTDSLGFDTPPDTRPKPLSEFFVGPSTGSISPDDIGLEECLRLALSHHPDLSVQKYADEAAGAALRSARSPLWPQVSMNGFYGKSGAAYRSEDLTMKEDWMVGARIEMNFGESSLGAQGLEQKTSPKIGQSSRTDTRTASASVGILDGLKKRSERKEAAFGKLQSEFQLRKIRMEVANRVREAFAGWKKAKTRLLIADNNLNLARTDFEIISIKSTHREAPLSDRAVMRNRSADAEAAYFEAQASYGTALAAFNQAVGVPEMFYIGGEQP